MTMTITNFEKMRAAQEKMYEIERSTTAIAHEFKAATAEMQENLKYDHALSQSGRVQKLEEFKTKQGAAFVKKAAEIRAEYDKAAIQAQVAAEMFLNEDAPAPSTTAVQTFERKLAEFQTSMLLATDPDKAMQLVKTFVGETQEPYFAGKLKGELPAIIKEVTTMAGAKAPVYKLQLSGVVDDLNHKASSGGRVEAQQVLDAGSKAGRDIFRANGLQLSAIEQAVGKQYARYANNQSGYEEEAE